MELEQEIMSLILYGGNAKGLAIEALRAAKEGNFEQADQFLEEADSNMNEAHSTQTKLIQAEIRGESVQLSLLMVHAQDHIMNAITTVDLCREIIEILRSK